MSESQEELAARGERMMSMRSGILSMIDSLSDSEKLSILTTVMAETMVKVADSKDQYENLVGSLAAILTNYPTIAQLIQIMSPEDDDEEVDDLVEAMRSVKH